ncbi:hypothetical protein A1OW_14340 [Enterovibrio norvegicus]|uniref:hypothetical protein n=1 Tax=Enterovibrio norvegicus TaxID=188144 RepID=UPI00031520A0|nr:hypothetical protein [Enterovibrio norvegicus]OEF48740.1 hypothetical protein A1OW_14340 [Enterovibrio norvegicus]
MKPVCVFCGNPPKNKNKEHIFPQWLLKLTGYDQKKVSVGSNWKTGEEFIFNSKAYTFPSCKICNDKFGKIEARVKPIFDKLMADQDVSVTDLELLLDWFDKVRISAWLGVKYMNKDVFGFDSRYYVNSRVGLKDRYLSITNTYKEEQKLNWSGVNTIAFMLSPTAFSLRVNNLVFVNCSSDFVVSKQLGFPYVVCEIPTPDKHTTDMQFAMPTKRVVKKMFKTHTYSPKIEIAQPIYKVTIGDLVEYYYHDYVRDNSYEEGIGKIFVSHGDGFAAVERDQVVSFSRAEPKHMFGHVEVVRPIIELQIELVLSKTRNLKNLSLSQKRDEKKGKKVIIDSLVETMNQYRY